MILQRMVFTVALLLATHTASAQGPVEKRPVPPLAIDDRGELQLENEQFSYAPWSTDKLPDKVHILQYIGATRSDSKLFKPLTDRLQESFERGQYHVTSIINLDAALWGTTGFVVSEIKDSKRKHPDSTLVLDEKGTGASQWQLGNRGAGLMIVDAQGIVRYFTREAMSEEDVTSSVDLVRQHMDSCLKSC